MIERLKHKLICFIEANKRDNDQQPSGWHQRIQTIYLHHYQQQKKIAHNKQPGPWRNYDKKE